jgi:hypothetical protein
VLTAEMDIKRSAPHSSVEAIPAVHSGCAINDRSVLPVLHIDSLCCAARLRLTALLLVVLMYDAYIHDVHADVYALPD